MEAHARLIAFSNGGPFVWRHMGGTDFNDLRADLRVAFANPQASAGDVECPFCTGPVIDSPLQKLGAYLADLLDEDQWATAEQYLNATLRSAETSAAGGGVGLTDEEALLLFVGSSVENDAGYGEEMRKAVRAIQKAYQWGRGVGIKLATPRPAPVELEERAREIWEKALSDESDPKGYVRVGCAPLIERAALRAIIAALSTAPAVDVKITDWLAVAKPAGDHGVRYRTNTAIEAFLTEIRPRLALPAAPTASDIAKQIKCITCGDYFDTTSAGVCLGCIKSGRRAEQVEARLPASNAASDAVELRVCIQRGLLAELGDTYDCTRVWEAWGVGTMDQDDFVPVLDRLDEIITTIAAEIAATFPALSTDAGGAK